MALAGAANAGAQFLVTLNDGTRITLDDAAIVFAGDTEDDGAVSAGDFSIALADINTIAPADPDAPKPMVIAYHTYYSPKLPPADKITHLNYAFAEVYVSDGVYIGFKLQGDESKFLETLTLKEQNPDLKILLSFTHTVDNPDNHQDGGFSAIAANADYRAAFAQDCLEFMQQYGIDGIDMDWEFPGLSWSGAACDPLHDVENYALLMKQMRETFGSDYLLTYAGYVMDKRANSGGGWRYIDLASVEPYVDYVNVMTYDLDAPNYHNSIKSNAYYDIERALVNYRLAGYDMRKVLIGIPFYARHDWSGTNSTVWYSKLRTTLKESKGYILDNWNETAGVPYITLNGQFWGSYDNERSIAGKARYAARNGLGGLFFWCDYQDDAKFTLLNATWDSAIRYMR